MNKVIKIVSLLCFYTLATFPTVPVKAFNIKDVILGNKIHRKIHDLTLACTRAFDGSYNPQLFMNTFSKRLKENDYIINKVPKEDTLECLDSLYGNRYNEAEMLIKILECHGVVLPDSESTDSNE